MGKNMVTLESLNWGLTVFIWYFTPLYIFMINSFNQKYHWHNAMDKIFSDFTIIVGVPIVSYMTVVYNNLWGIQIKTFSIWLIYLAFFFGMYFYLKNQVSSFQAFVISALSIFAISEIWEIPIKLNNLIMFQDRVFNIIVISIFKMSSIPMLLYLAVKWKWKVTCFTKDFLIVLYLIMWFLLVNGLFYINDFSYGILLRIIVGIVISVSAVGYSRSQNASGMKNWEKANQ
jgi:hypothetical protein